MTQVELVKARPVRHVLNIRSTSPAPVRQACVVWRSEPDSDPRGAAAEYRGRLAFEQPIDSAAKTDIERAGRARVVEELHHIDGYVRLKPERRRGELARLGGAMDEQQTDIWRESQPHSRDRPLEQRARTQVLDMEAAARASNQAVTQP